MAEFIKLYNRRINIDDVSWYLPSGLNSSFNQDFQVAVKMKSGDHFVFSGKEAQWILEKLDRHVIYDYEK